VSLRGARRWIWRALPRAAKRRAPHAPATSTPARREKLHKQIEEGQKQVQKLRAEIGATQQAEAEAGGGNT